MADTGRSLQMHADRVSFEEADIQIALKPVRLLQHRMTAESPLRPMLRVARTSAITFERQKPSTTNWVLNGVFGSVNLGSLFLCQKGAFLEHILGFREGYGHTR